MLDQYHRRRRLSVDLHRSFRRQIEFNALGITSPGNLRSLPDSFDAHRARASRPVTNAVAEEFDRLKAELAIERKRSQRYRHRIGTLAQYGHRQRTSLAQEDVAAPAGIEQPAPVDPAVAEELDRLKVELTREREKAQRYRHRIDTLAQYGHRQRTSLAQEVVEAPAGIEQPVPAGPAVIEELERLRVELAREHEKAQRYRHRIGMLARYGHRRRATSMSRVVTVVPPTTRTAHVVHASLISRVAPAWISRRELVAAWLLRKRRYQLPHVGSAAAVLLAATSIIASSTSNLGLAPNLIAATSALVSAGPIPELQVSPIPEPPTISLAQEKFVVLPGYTLATIHVERTGGGNGPVKFTWWTQSAGAKVGKDFAFGKSKDC